MKLPQTAAEAIAIDALSFLASDPEVMQRFIASTGIDPDAIREDAAKPGFLAGVMHHIVENESLLIEFAASAGLKPEQVAAAAQALGMRWE